MRIWLNALSLLLLTFPLSARAEDHIVPDAGWFAGLGGSFNSVNFDQDLFANGVGDVYSGTTLVATGAAGGPANPRENTESIFAPAAQLGYFGHFGASNWLWGGKVFYRYVDATATTSDIAPQAGALQTLSGPDSFTGNVVIGSYRTKLDHLIALTPFIGRSFERSSIYLGAGPALFRTQTRIDNAIGFADVNGIHADATGAPLDFASSQWVWGGAAQIGLSYYLDRHWFLDVNYTYARSAKFKSNFSAPFASLSAGYYDVGTLFVKPSQRVTDQSVSISINRRF
jgi:opacity protein-like surface antigen